MPGISSLVMKLRKVKGTQESLEKREEKKESKKNTIGGTPVPIKEASQMPRKITRER